MNLTQLDNFDIVCDMSGYATKIKSIRIGNHVADETPALPQQIAEARGALGELGWLAKQIRGDLSTQVSLGATVSAPSKRKGSSQNQ